MTTRLLINTPRTTVSLPIPARLHNGPACIFFFRSCWFIVVIIDSNQTGCKQLLVTQSLLVYINSLLWFIHHPDSFSRWGWSWSWRRILHFQKKQKRISKMQVAKIDKPLQLQLLEYTLSSGLELEHSTLVYEMCVSARTLDDEWKQSKRTFTHHHMTTHLTSLIILFFFHPFSHHREDSYWNSFHLVFPLPIILILFSFSPFFSLPFCNHDYHNNASPWPLLLFFIHVLTPHIYSHPSPWLQDYQFASHSFLFHQEDHRYPWLGTSLRIFFQFFTRHKWKALPSYPQWSWSSVLLQSRHSSLIQLLPKSQNDSLECLPNPEIGQPLEGCCYIC